jgi:hypothetical protein
MVRLYFHSRAAPADTGICPRGDSVALRGGNDYRATE